MKSLTLSALIASSLALTGCSTLFDNSDKLIKPVLSAFNTLCKEAPKETRDKLKTEKAPQIIAESKEDFKYLDVEKVKKVELCKD